MTARGKRSMKSSPTGRQGWPAAEETARIAGMKRPADQIRVWFLGQSRHRPPAHHLDVEGQNRFWPGGRRQDHCSRFQTRRPQIRRRSDIRLHCCSLIRTKSNMILSRNGSSLVEAVILEKARNISKDRDRGDR